jgi:hypothetical protein
MCRPRRDPVWRGPDLVRQVGVRVCVCTVARVCVCLEGAQGKAPEAWRDANAMSQPCRGVAAHSEAVAWALRGWGVAHGSAGRRRVSRHGCAHTRTGPGTPWSRHGRAVSEAPEFRARGMMRRRRATEVAGCRGGATGPCTRGGTAAGWERES